MTGYVHWEEAEGRGVGIKPIKKVKAGTGRGTKQR